MSIGISKEQMENEYNYYHNQKDLSRKLEEIKKQYEKMNDHSRKIIKFEGDLSDEGREESGKMQGRLQMLKLICEVFEVDI